MTLTLEELWVKAAVEHRIVYVSYKNPETRLVYNNRDVRPELVTADPAGNATFWGLLHHNPFIGRKSFSPQYFTTAKLTKEQFKPLSNDWQQLVPIYQELGLEAKDA
ncbi:MAG: hypothetical protein WDA16_04515 [Candidatus Thermoplasmatota archaeon]